MPLLPFTSVTVNIMVLLPTSAQVNVLILKLMPLILQLSVEPLFTAAAVVTTVPVALNCSVKLRQLGVGLTVS